MEDKKKNNPVGVRFNKKSLQKIMATENLATPQAVVNFLVKWYEQTKWPITVAPTIERWEPQTGEAPAKKQIIVEKSTAPKPEKNRKLSDKFANVRTDKIDSNTPPLGLTGIDLTIWKRENGIK